MAAAGWFVVIAGVLYFALKLHVSYTSGGGAYGGVPILDGAIFPPAFAAAGLWVVQRVSGWPGVPGWAFAVGWLVATVAVAWLLVKVGDLGERKCRPR